jgi:demethylmenaquinone methyltransferase/2-methoxy-6-polyprenyl-1,4-benzoquinol methylase
MNASSRPSASSLAPHPPLRDYYHTEEQREQLLAAQFDRVAPDYNWITQVSSFGTGKWYRQLALKRAGLTKGKTVLDVACGPGTVAVCAQQIVGESGRVVGLDPSHGMVTQAHQQGVSTVLQGKAEHLPFPDSKFDFISMGYALRHVSDLTLTFKEYLRVLKPGGQLLILEISRPDSFLPYQMSRFFLKRVIPWVAYLGTKNPHAHKLMKYYWDTIESCVPPETILQALKNSGFNQSQQYTLFGGLLRDYSGCKP